MLALVTRRLAPLVVLVTAAALTAAGCGGSSDKGSETSPTAEWADGLCTVLATWKGAISSVGDTLGSGVPSKESLTSAADDVQAANQELVDGLSGLGKPDTAAGQDAKDSIDQLSTDLEADVQKIEDAVGGASGVSDVLNAVSVVASTLSTMGTQVSSTLQELEQLDAKGELRDALEQSSACKDLTQSGS
jgi:hypothetical protein